MHEFLLDWLVCPRCRSGLSWPLIAMASGIIMRAQARCDACDASYPVREGIALMLDPRLPREDLWEQVEGGLGQAVRADPKIEERLMQGPVEALAPADQFLRGLLLEERGELEVAGQIIQQATRLLYTREYLACADEMVEKIVERLLPGDGPIVDLACGRGRLLERMATDLMVPFVATDFSPRILRANLRRWRWPGIHNRISLLAADARQMPFGDGTVRRMVSFLGLPNIQEPERALSELRRVVSGELMAVMHFFPENDAANRKVILQAGLETVMYRQSALAAFEGAGFEVQVVDVRQGRAAPTPSSRVLEGMGIDGLPVAETTLEWCLVLAR